MFGRWHGCWVGILVGWLALSAAAQGTPEIPKALEKEAARALGTKRSEIEGSLGIVHELVRRRHAAGEYKKTISLLRKATRAAPWDMLCHVYYAEALQALGKKKAARKKALWILDHAREDRARQGAAKIADEPLPPAPRVLERASDEFTRIVLVPFPPVDTGLLQAVAERMAGRLTAPVEVRSFPFKPAPKAARNDLAEAVENHRIRLEERVKDDELQALLKSCNLGMDDLLLDHVFVPFYRAWLIRVGRWKDLRNFDHEVTRDFRPQWDATKLAKFIQESIGRVRRARDFYLVITSDDIFMGANRYNFAVSGGRFSLISYSRFLPWFARGDPDWETLVIRTCKQALCSVGRCAGVLKCSVAGCPCMYANGLQEHDAKTEEYCDTCRGKIEAAVGR